MAGNTATCVVVVQIVSTTMSHLVGVERKIMAPNENVVAVGQIIESLLLKGISGYVYNSLQGCLKESFHAAIYLNILECVGNTQLFLMSARAMTFTIVVSLLSLVTHPSAFGKSTLGGFSLLAAYIIW